MKKRILFGLIAFVLICALVAQFALSYGEQRGNDSRFIASSDPEPISSPSDPGDDEEPPGSYPVIRDVVFHHNHVWNYTESVALATATITNAVNVRAYVLNDGGVLYRSMLVSPEPDQYTVLWSALDMDGMHPAASPQQPKTVNFSLIFIATSSSGQDTIVQRSFQYTYTDSQSAASRFQDVPSGEWYTKAVAWAVANGLTSGVDETHFAPGTKCSRSQVVQFLWNASFTGLFENSTRAVETRRAENPNASGPEIVGDDDDDNGGNEGDVLPAPVVDTIEEVSLAPEFSTDSSKLAYLGTITVHDCVNIKGYILDEYGAVYNTPAFSAFSNSGTVSVDCYWSTYDLYGRHPAGARTQAVSRDFSLVLIAQNSDGNEETASCQFTYVFDDRWMQFVDVSGSAWYTPAVAWAVANHVTSGVDATHFAPNKSCTRAEFVQFLWTTMGRPAPLSYDNPFRDVKPGDWFYDAVMWAYSAGVTRGTDATHFSPKTTCSRSEVVQFLYGISH